MLEGSFQHEDFCGHKGTINPGDLQVNMHLQYVMVCMSDMLKICRLTLGFQRTVCIMACIMACMLVYACWYGYCVLWCAC